MGNKDLRNTPASSLLKDLGENYFYLKTIISKRIEITKLEFIQHFSIVLSRILVGMIFSILFLIAILFLLVALAIYLGSLLGSYVYGFLIIAAFSIIAGMLFYIFLSPMLGSYLSYRLEKIDLSSKDNTHVK